MTVSDSCNPSKAVVSQQPLWVEHTKTSYKILRIQGLWIKCVYSLFYTGGKQNQGDGINSDDSRSCTPQCVNATEYIQRCVSMHACS